ncbi:hypothetical protein ABZ079_32400 [Streptomyces sp. NPDC006314]|uniref:hypothetical protein n=1 Tax=Streptomyces sp. NPDC006314 TaxID=3154475 RepID=UPI0033A82106
MSVLGDGNPSGLDGLRRQLDALSKQLEELKERVEEMGRVHERRNAKAFCLSVVGLLLGLLVDLFKN